ncbi:hypothetical protein [Halorhabdus rudnickae]|uniref:hypothetical protein n=1 Tax=Halorhabdus rudnickae TaxID=1775544 RepID=UPI001FCEF9EF|nr:hypothetical protein [Halorhabdus rudnickae]
MGKHVPITEYGFVSSNPTDPDRGQGKGRSRNEGEDPSEEFEDSADSEQADDAQQLLDEIEEDLDNDVPESGDTESEGGAGGSTVDAPLGEFGGESDGSEDGDSQEQDTGYEHIDDNPTGITLSRQELRNREVAEEVADAIDEEAWLSDVSEEYPDQIQSLAEEGLTPNAPDHVNIESGEEFEPLALSEDRETGASDTSMWVVTDGDGNEMYVTLDNSSAMGQPMASTAMVNSFRNALSDEARDDVNFPDMAIDNEREAAVVASVGAEDSSSTNKYRPRTVDTEFKKDDYLSAAASKLVLGDTDLGGNVVTSKEGRFHPIDYDLAGSRLQSRDESVREDTDRHEGQNSVWDSAQSKASRSTRRFDFEVEADELRSKAREIAQETDVDKLEQNLSESPHISSKKKENVLSNIRDLREGEL